MLSTYKLFNEQYSILEEGAGKQISAFLSGLGGLTPGGLTGVIQTRNLGVYQKLEDKLDKKEFHKRPLDILSGWFLGIIPLVGAFMNLSNQKKIDKIRNEIMKKMDRNLILHLEELTKKVKKKTISKKELKELVEINSKLLKQFNREEIRKLKSIAKSG